MNKLLESVGNNIVEIFFIAAFLIGVVGMGVLISMGVSDSNDRYTKCLDAGKQYIDGNCVN